MLKAAIVEVVREEVRAALHGAPTPAQVAEDLGTVLGSLPSAEGCEFAKALLPHLWAYIDSHTEQEPEPAGAEGTGEQEE